MKLLIAILLITIGLNATQYTASSPIRIQEAIKCCESTLKENLLCPSTYKRVDINYIIDTTEGLNRILIKIDYDANNAFNAPIRSDGRFIANRGHCIQLTGPNEEDGLWGLWDEIGYLGKNIFVEESE